MKRVNEHEAKPLGWFWWVAPKDGTPLPSKKISQGNLRISTDTIEFREWFIRIPVTGTLLTVGHYEEKEASWNSYPSQ